MLCTMLFYSEKSNTKKCWKGATSKSSQRYDAARIGHRVNAAKLRVMQKKYTKIAIQKVKTKYFKDSIEVRTKMQKKNIFPCLHYDRNHKFIT